MLCVSGKVEDELKDCVYYERILNVHARDGIFGSVRMYDTIGSILINR